MWDLLLFIKNLIFNLNKENIEQSAKSIVDKFSNTYPFSFNLLIVRITHAALVLREKEIDLYLNFLKEIQKLEMSFLKEIDIFDIYIYAHFYDNENRQEFHYMITKMIESKLIDKKILDNICTRDINFHGGYFLQYMTNEKIKDLEYYESVKFITDNYEELSKNDFELHKKLIEDGHNPNEITKIIRNDEIEKLQEISSQEDFDFDQTIEPSPYERCSFVNNYASLINYAAFFGSVKCFKYLLMNGANLSNTGQYAVAGGNEEIIHLCEQNHSSFQNAYETAIKFQRNDIFKYIYEKKLEKFGENNVIQYIVGANKKNILEELGKNCVSYFNFEIFSFLQKEGMKINDDIINVSADFGNIFLVKHFLQHNQIPKDILVFSARSGNFELVKYILEHESININVKDIYLFYFIFILIISYFKIIFGNCLNYLERDLFGHL